MADIRSFIGAPSKGGSRAERFQANAKGKSKAELRELETALLKPEAIPEYTGEEPPAEAAKPLTARTIKFVLPTKADREMFQKHFSVSHHIEASVANPVLLMAILKALEKGIIVYDKATGKITRG